MRKTVINRISNAGMILFLVLALISAALPSMAASPLVTARQDGPHSPWEKPYVYFIPDVHSKVINDIPQPPQPTPPPPPPPTTTGRVSNLNVITQNVAPYDKFEAQFDVETAAADLSLPFDPNPPAGLPAGAGVSVSVLFSRDNWGSYYTQPAFYYQPYIYSDRGKDHFSPDGAPRWAVRFAPQAAGDWQYRISVQDKDGLSYYPDMGNPALSFTVSGISANPYTQKGFLRVSQNDPRYFEFENGEPFVGVGFNDGFDNVAAVEQKMQSYEQNKMNFMRVWMSGAGINGSQWSSWASNFLNQDGYLPGVDFDTHTTYNGADVSLRLDDGNPCFYTDFWQGGVPAEPNTQYTVWARIKLENVGGNGFTIKQGNWLDKGCSSASTGVNITSPASGSTDWITVQGTYRTGSDQYWLNYLYLALQDSPGGKVYITEVRVYRSDDPNQVNILREGNANSHMYFDQMNSAQWDRFVESAQNHGVYLKLVIDEKNEWIRNHIDQNGNMTDTADNNHFYAPDGTKVRWLQEAWWRYIIARWGYSTAIHSFEYINEGDPYNGNLYDISNAMARYFHQNDPSRHMVATSFWSSFPNGEFWSNPSYPDMDYADIHAYIATGWGKTATLINSARIETNPANIHSGNGAARIDNGVDANFNQDFTPRGLVVRGQGTWTIRYWMKAQNFTANCPYGSSGGMQRIRYYIDPGSNATQGVVPAGPDGKDFVCTSPGGTYNWQQLSGTFNLGDDNSHTFIMRLENSNGTGGSAWIDDVQLIDPNGRVADVLGSFDITPMDEDTAWYNYAYGSVFGGKSVVGAHKPLVRGETGIDFVGNQDWNRDLLKDTQGIWLHNNVWGQINPGGMYDLFWWATETIQPGIYSNFLTYRKFMEGIPLSNGNYHDVGARTSDGNLRAWGQRDDANGRMHLWVQNVQHTWVNVVNNANIPSISGSVTIPNVPAGTYRIEWWDPYNVDNPIFRTDSVTSGGGDLTLNLPISLKTDLGIKIEKVQ